MSINLPSNFIDLNTACRQMNALVNVMGIVTDFLPPCRSRGKDWMFSFSMIDPSFCGISEDGLKVRFFKPMESEMPLIRGTGDVVLLRSLKVMDFNGMTVGVSSRETHWTIFPAASIPTKPLTSGSPIKYLKEPRGPNPSKPEMQYATNICNSRDRSTFTQSASSPILTQNTSANRIWRDKFSLIKDISSDTYYDLVGQAVKTYSHHDRVELYLTDYTSNNLLFNYEWGQDDQEGNGREGDEYNYVPHSSTNRKWPGPFGKMTMTVTLWPPHAHFGRQNIKENDFLYLRNVHVKFSQDSKLEGVLHSDRRYPDRIDVNILKNNEDDDRVKDVLRRKREYVKRFQKSSENFVDEARAQKRKEMEEAKPLSKTAARKKRKQERELAIAKTYQASEGPAKRESAAVSDKHQSCDTSPLSNAQKQYTNKNVNCANHLITPRSLSSISSLDKHENKSPEGTVYTLPFQNIKSRALVRVIDYFPPELADFAVPCHRSSEFDILSEPSVSEEDSEDTADGRATNNEIEEDRQWEWRFGLIVEDAIGRKSEEKATMEVYVAGQDAECLLKLDATNLRKSSTALAKLREKLFLLWGDLEERKTTNLAALKEVDGNSRPTEKGKAPNNLPFECCLKEYGVKKKTPDTVEKDGKDDKLESADENEGWVWERRWRMFGTTII